MDYVDLPIIDLAKAGSAEDRGLLATQVRDALLTHGFFYVINHGYRQSEARSPLSESSTREPISDMETDRQDIRYRRHTLCGRER